MDWFSCGIGWFSIRVEWGSCGFSIRFPLGSLGLGFFGKGFSSVPSGKGFFVEGLLGIPSKEGFSSLLGLLGSLGLGFFGEGFSGLLACGVFSVFALYFVGLALGGGLLGVNFLLGC